MSLVELIGQEFRNYIVNEVSTTWERIRIYLALFKREWGEYFGIDMHGSREVIDGIVKRLDPLLHEFCGDDVDCLNLGSPYGSEKAKELHRALVDVAEEVLSRELKDAIRKKVKELNAEEKMLLLTVALYFKSKGVREVPDNIRCATEALLKWRREIKADLRDLAKAGILVYTGWASRRYTYTYYYIPSFVVDVLEQSLHDEEILKDVDESFRRTIEFLLSYV